MWSVVGTGVGLGLEMLFGEVGGVVVVTRGTWTLTLKLIGAKIDPLLSFLSSAHRYSLLRYRCCALALPSSLPRPTHPKNLFILRTLFIMFKRGLGNEALR